MIALAELKGKSCSDSEAVAAIRACIARSTELGGVEGGSAHEWGSGDGKMKRWLARILFQASHRRNCKLFITT